jgi:hypothetical protein
LLLLFLLLQSVVGKLGIHLARGLPCERFMAALASRTSCITRGRGGWLNLPRGGLPPPILCQLPGALRCGSITSFPRCLDESVLPLTPDVLRRRSELGQEQSTRPLPSKGYGGPHPRRDFLSVGVDAGVGPGESSKFKIAKLLFPRTAGLRRTRTLASGGIYGRPR